MGELVIQSETGYAFHRVKMINRNGFYCKTFHQDGNYLICKGIIEKEIIKSDEPREFLFKFQIRDDEKSGHILRDPGDIYSSEYAKKSEDSLTLCAKDLDLIKSFKNMEDWMLVTKEDALEKARTETKKQNIEIKEKFNENVILMSEEIAQVLNERKGFLNFKTYKSEDLIGYVTRECIKLKNSTVSYFIQINPKELIEKLK
jgi:hypothetical protein